MPRKKRRKRRTQGDIAADEADEEKAPKSFVIRRGKVGNKVISLVRNFREVMMPNTATALKESTKNKLKDFINVAPTLNVTHMMVFSKSSVGLNMRIIKVPRGPTLTFRVLKYSLKQDVSAMYKKPHVATDKELLDPPLLVLNNFTEASVDNKFLSATLQSMFPSIDLEKIQLKNCRRVVLFHKNKEENIVEIRHYLIKATPTGISKSVKKIVRARIPDLGRLRDISDFVERDMVSDSEAEDNPDNKINLPQDFVGRGNRKSSKSAIRLKEIGPRITVQLIKIEEGVNSGATLYHAFEERTPEEAEALREKKKKEADLKKMRRLEQERNVERKKQMKLAKKNKRKGASGSEADIEIDEEPMKTDADWYREEVGEEPPDELFDRFNTKSRKPTKKRKDREEKKESQSSKGSTMKKKKKKGGRS
eukprot:CAMPEP_0167752004 /NCGR_PEP_ID=MMETSP0110_2-20121227/6892_1 /TAXON_ID=629695 /ORGANISM="Gymnochlora sp., Strain CCMP2014" /LENGTH=421 /DNA_ID=CAMNT_0007637561 /DNA_START=36 /DNA_END=1301 /DNA_ORIENTATION=-